MDLIDAKAYLHDCQRMRVEDIDRSRLEDAFVVFISSQPDRAEFTEHLGGVVLTAGMLWDFVFSALKPLRVGG